MAEYRTAIESLLDESLGIARRKQQELTEASQRKQNEFNPINAGNLEHVDGDTWRLKDSGRRFRVGSSDPALSFDAYESDPQRYEENPDKFRAHRRAYARLTGKPEFLISKNELAERGKAQAFKMAQRMEAAAKEGRLGFRTVDVDAYGRDVAEVVDLQTGQSFFDFGREQNAAYYADQNAGQRVRDAFSGVQGEYEAFSGGRGLRAFKDQFGNFAAGTLSFANDLLHGASIVTGVRSNNTDAFFERSRENIEKVKRYLVSEEQLSRERRDQRNAARNEELYDLRKAEYLSQGLSDRAASIRAGTEEFFDSIGDMLLNPGAILDKTVESLPYMIGVGLAGRAAVKAASNQLRKNTIKQVAAAGGTAEQAAASAARYAQSKAGKKILSRVGTATGVGTIGLTEGLSTGAGIYSSIMNMSEEEAMQSEKYQALRLDQGMSHTEAKQVLAEEAFDQTFLTAVAVAGAASLITGAAAFETKLFTRMADVRKATTKPATKAAASTASRGLVRTATGAVLRGAGRATRYAGPSGLKEAAEESIQSGSQEFLTQLAQFDAGVGEAPGPGIGRATGEGAAVGFATGAGARAVTGTVKKIANADLRTSALPQIKRTKPGTREAVLDRSGSPGGSKEAALNKTKNLTPDQANKRIDQIVKRIEEDDAESAKTLRTHNEFKQYVDVKGEENLTPEQKAAWETSKANFNNTIDRLAQDILKEAKPIEQLEPEDRKILQEAMEADTPAVRNLAKNDNAVARIYKQVKRTVQVIENATNNALENAGQFTDIDAKYNQDGKIAREKMGRGLASNGKPGLLGHFDRIMEAIAEGNADTIKKRSEALSNFIASQRLKIEKVGKAIDKKADFAGVTYKEKTTEAYYNKLRDEMADMIKVRDGLEQIAQGWQGEPAQSTEAKGKGRKVEILAPAPDLPPARVVQTINEDTQEVEQPERVITPKRKRNEERTEQGQAQRTEQQPERSESSARSSEGTQPESSDTGSAEQPDVVTPKRGTQTQSQKREGSNAEQAASLVGEKTSTLQKRLRDLNAKLDKVRTGKTYPVEAKSMLDERKALVKELNKRADVQQPEPTNVISLEAERIKRATQVSKNLFDQLDKMVKAWDEGRFSQKRQDQLRKALAELRTPKNGETFTATEYAVEPNPDTGRTVATFLLRGGHIRRYTAIDMVFNIDPDGKGNYVITFEVNEAADTQTVADASPAANDDRVPRESRTTEAAIFDDGDFLGALAIIAANSENRLYRALATRLGRILQGRDIAVITLDDNAFEAYMRAYAPDLVNASAAMLHDRQEIVMRDKYRGHENMEQAFLHEATHAAVNGWMTRPKTTPAAKALHSRAQTLRDQILRELRKGARENPTDSRWTNVLSRFEKNQEEWITYAWSNPQTQEILREIQMTETLTAWDKFLKVVKDILGLEGRTALDHVLAVSDKIFEQNEGQRGASPRSGATYQPSPEAVEQARQALNEDRITYEADGEVEARAEAQPERSAETEPEGPSAETIAKNDFWWDALRETQRLIAALQSGRLQAEEVAYLDRNLDSEYKTRLGANTVAGALAQMETYIRENLNEQLPRTKQNTTELKMPEILRIAQEIRNTGKSKAASKVIQAAEGFDTEAGFNRIQRWLLGKFDRPNIGEYIRDSLAKLGLPVSVDSGFRQASKTAKSLITAVPNLHAVLANPDARRELYDALGLSPSEEKAFETFRNFRNEFANAVNKAYEDLSGGKIQFPDGNRVQQNPAYLLTDLSDVMDPAAVTAMAYEAMNWLTGEGQRLSNDEDTIRDILGLPDNTDLEPNQKILTTFGTLRRNVVSSMGRAAYRHLNIAAEQSPDISPNLDERMEQALGTLMVRALVISNRVEPVVMDGKGFAALKGEELTEHEDYSRPVNFIRIMSFGKSGRERFYHSNENADLIDDIRPGRTAFTRLFGISNVVREPLLTEPTEDNIPTKARRSLMRVSKGLRDAIGFTQKQAWGPDMRTIDTLKRFDNIRDFLAVGHEYQTNMNEVHALDKDAVQARNRTLETMVENAIKWTDENGTDDFYLTYFVTKTGRTNVGSTFINPQSSKIHRFLFRMKAWNSTVPLTGSDKTLLNNFKIAVALGMDFKIDKKGVDKLTQEDVLAQFDAYMDSNDVQDALAILAKDGSISLRGEANKPLRNLLSKQGVHTLAALLAWQEYQTARDSGAKSFETSMPMEVDGVTNGFAAGLLQTPPIDPRHLERIKDLSRATGMGYDKDTARSFAEWLKDPSNRDNYQAAALLMAENMRQIAGDPDIAAVLAQSLGPSIKDLMNPKVGRDFAKNPLMIIAYGAGFASVRRNKVERLIMDMYNELAKISSFPANLQMSAILNALNRSVRVMNAGQRMFFKDVLKKNVQDFQVKKEYTAEDVQRMIDRKGIINKETGKPVANLAEFAQNFQFGQLYDKDRYSKHDMGNLRYGLDQAYGVPLEDSLARMLAGIRQVRERYNHAVMLMNAIFRVEFDRRVGLIEQATGRVVGRRQRSQILDQMHREGLVPSIRTAYSRSLDENLELTAYQNDLLPDEEVKIVHTPQGNVTRRFYDENGNKQTLPDTQSTTSRLTTRTPSMDVGVAGIVKTIHSLDGTNSADVFGKYAVLNVFDAWVMSLADMDNVPHWGSQRFAQQHREYDLGQELLTSLNRMMLLMQPGENRFSLAQRERVQDIFYKAMAEANQLNRVQGEYFESEVGTFSEMPDSPAGLMYYVSDVLAATVPQVTANRESMAQSMIWSNQFAHDGSSYELTAEERGAPLPRKEAPEDYVNNVAAAQKIESKAATLANNLAESGNFHKAFFNWLQEEAVRPREALRVIATAMEMAGLRGAETINDLLAMLHPHLYNTKVIKVGPLADPSALAQYTANEITIDDEKFTEQDNPLESLLHEIVHAATDSALHDLEETNPALLDELNKNATKLFSDLKRKRDKTQQETDIMQVLAYQDDKVLRVGEYLAWTLSSIAEDGAGDLGLLYNNTRVLSDAMSALGQTLTRGNRQNPIIRSSSDKVNNKLFDHIEEDLLETDKIHLNLDAFEAIDAQTDAAEAADYRAFISPVMDDILIPGLASLDVQTFLQLGVETDGTKNVGEVERASDRNILRVQAAGRKLNHNGGMSSMEVFAHELYHAVTGFTLSTDQRVRAELRKIFEGVQDQITWEDFMPPANERAGDIAAMERAAKAAYDYVFGVPKEGVDQLQEFAAMGLSNKALATKLTQLEAPGATEPLWDGNILSFLVNLVTRGLDLIRSAKLGTRKALNAQDALRKLSQQIVVINQQADARRYDKAGHNGMWRNKADNAASRHLTQLLDRAQERLRLSEEEKLQDGSMLRWLRMGTHAALAQRTEAQQRANNEFLRHMGVNRASDLAQAITEILPYNKDDRGGADGKIGFLDLLRKSKVEVDIARQRAIEHTHSTLMNGFDKKQRKTKAQRLAMTNVVIRTDLPALIEHNKDRTYRDIHQMLHNPALVRAEITRLERELNAELGRQNIAQLETMYLNQIDSLAQYQTTGVMGQVNGMKNAHNIVHQHNRLRAADKVKVPNAAPLVAIVDQLATLRALQKTAPHDIDLALQVIDHEMAREASAGQNGFFDLLGIVDSFKKSSLEDLFRRNPVHMRKGYVKDMTDGDINVEVIIDTPENRQRMEDLGMVEIGIVDRDPRDYTTTGRRVMYKGFRGLNSWMKATVSLTSRQGQGTSLFEVAGFDPKQTRYALGQMKARNDVIAARQYDSNFVQDPRETLAVPVLDDDGNIVDYTYEMSLANRQQHLKNRRHNDYFDQVIPSMFGSIADKMGTNKVNSETAQLLFDEWIAFKDSSEHRFVEVGKNVSDKRGREMWQVLPDEMKRELNQLFKGTEFANGFPIRDEAVNLVLGFRKLSILDLPSGRGDDRKLIRGKTATFAARTAEKVWQEIMQLVRINMAITNPAVVVGNLSSNFGILLAEGIPVRYIQEKTSEAIRSMRQYQKDVREIDDLERKIGIGRAARQNVDSLVRRREQLKAAISRNPVAELVQEGLFTSIVEDVQSQEGTYREFIFAETLDRAKNPLAAKTLNLTKEVYMIPGSNSFNMAIAATQYGDFIGRYIKYTYDIKVKGINKRDAINKALASFIYYDMPQNRWLQFLNDNGFIMFSKFFLRIQPVVARLFQDNPMKAVGVLAAQQALMSPFDENIGTFALFQGWSNRVELMPFRHLPKLEPTNPSLFQWLWPFGL